MIYLLIAIDFLVRNQPAVAVASGVESGQSPAAEAMEKIALAKFANASHRDSLVRKV